jgi:hypothetical protein
MRTFTRACQSVFLLFLVFSLVGSAPSPANAGVLSWSRVNIPAEGPNAGWVLAPGSDVRCLTFASDGTLYCAANPASTPYRLFKSTDHGVSWSYTGRVTDNITAIALPLGNLQQIFYATASRVYQSDDAGSNFQLIGDCPGGAGAGGVEITSLAAASANGTDCVMIGTRDNDNLEFGGVYLLEQGGISPWYNTAVGGYDIVSVAFSPAFTSDRQLVAVGTDERNTVITTSIQNTGWNTEVGAACLEGIACLSASIAFPADYQSWALDKYTQFIGINTGIDQGEVYRLEGRAAPDSSRLICLAATVGSAKKDIASLAVSGNATAACLIAGAAGIAGVYTSTDSGTHWQTSRTPPSGDLQTYVALAADSSASSLIFAATSGNESGFSSSSDGGQTWQQTGLIDTRITSLRDLVLSPDFSRDGGVFLVTAGQRTSVWRSRSAGQAWERIFYSSAVSFERFNQVLFSPLYAGNRRVLINGTAADIPCIWESRDGGSSFSRTSSIDPQSGLQVNIDAWSISSADVLYVAGHGQSHTVIYQTAPGGVSYIDQADCGSQSVYSLAISPDLSGGPALLVGTTGGAVFYSTSEVMVFEQLLGGAINAPAGNVSVAFDREFSLNNIIYAAGDQPNTGLFRVCLDSGQDWEKIDAALPIGTQICRLVMGSTGVLYTADSQVADPDNCKGGVERYLTPAASALVVENAVVGLTAGSVLSKLYISGSILWAIDTAHTALYSFQDTLTLPVALSVPANGRVGLVSHNLDLAWEPVAGATAYHWQLDMDAAFPGNPEEKEGETGSNATRIATLDENTSYFWRVRVSQPFTGPWSEIRSFNTFAVGVPHLSEPKSGASSVTPAFKWSSADNANNYELQVSRNDTFTDLIINKQGASACPITTWQCDIVLPYSTSYYWRVRGMLNSTPGEWSEVAVFTTMAAPKPPTNGGSTPSPSPTPLAAPKLIEPKSNGPVPLKPVFKWSESTGAEEYELVVSRFDDFALLAIDKTGDNACHANAWVCEKDLEYGVSYYWKVRAVNNNGLSPWSAVGVFTTITRPSPTPSTPSSTTAPPSSPAMPSTSLTQTGPPSTSPPLVKEEPQASSPAAATTMTTPPAPVTELARSTIIPSVSTTALPQQPGIGLTNRLIFFLIGGLVVLTGILIVVVVYMLRKFRRF